MIKLCSYIYKHPDDVYIEWFTLIQGKKQVGSRRSIEKILDHECLELGFYIGIDPDINYKTICEFDSIQEFIDSYPEYRI